MTTLTFPTSASEQALLDRYAQSNAEYLRMLYDCGHVKFCSTDIALAKAMICWDRGTKRMAVLTHPDDGTFRTLGMSSDIGASESGWASVPTIEQMHRVWNLVVRLHLDHKFDIQEMLSALDVIPEWRAMRKFAR